MIRITFPDNSVREYEKGVTSYDIAMSISPRLAKVMSIRVNLYQNLKMVQLLFIHRAISLTCVAGPICLIHHL